MTVRMKRLSRSAVTIAILIALVVSTAGVGAAVPGSNATATDADTATDGSPFDVSDWLTPGETDSSTIDRSSTADERLPFVQRTLTNVFSGLFDVPDRTDSPTISDDDSQTDREDASEDLSEREDSDADESDVDAGADDADNDSVDPVDDGSDADDDESSEPLDDGDEPTGIEDTDSTDSDGDERPSDESDDDSGSSDDASEVDGEESTDGTGSDVDDTDEDSSEPVDNEPDDGTEETNGDDTGERTETDGDADESDDAGDTDTEVDDDEADDTTDDGTVDRALVERHVHEAINEERTARGLEALAFDEDLQEIARSHSEDMAERGYFAHEDPEGNTFADRYDAHGYECRADTDGSAYYTGGENIAYTYVDQPVRTDSGDVVEHTTERKLADGLVEQWMNSDGHRENLLADHWTNEGIGISVTDDDRVYATQNFC